MSTAKTPISERAQQLLKAVIERYIRDGQPVGSKTLAEEGAMGLSPATIRNVLAELEELGYLSSPHTSAGRVPTVQGYRLFVNSLITVQPLDNNTVQHFKKQLNLAADTTHLVTSTSNLLADLTHLAGLVMLPKREHLPLRHVEFLPLSDNRILVILVLNEHEVQNRIITTDRIYNISELQQAANYLNATFAGHDLLAIRKKILEAMREDRNAMNRLMQAVIEVADKAFEKPQNDTDYILAGQSHLLGLADVTGLNQVQQLFEVFSQKRDILHLLDQCLNTQGVQIFIGEESGYSVLDSCSLVTAPYRVEGEAVGVLGVIGPTRMAYDRVIPIVDITAKLLSAALNQS